MQQWKINERIAHEWVKVNIDPAAILHGGTNCKAPDITLSNGDVYEVKSLHAQCGQFTEGTVHNYEYSNEVMEYFMGAYDREIKDNDKLNHAICTMWVRSYYENKKKVKMFLVVDNKGNVSFETLDDYFNNHSFSCTYRSKKSGTTSNTPKWCYKQKYIPSDWNCVYDGKKYMIAQNPKAIGQKLQVINTKGDEKTMWVDNEGRVKLLSDTATPTFVFNVR